MNPLHCSRCAKLFDTQPAFQFQTPGGPIHRCLRCSLVYTPMLRRSSTVAAIVGTILVGINQGDAMFHGLWPASLLWKVPLTYAVPFAVASVGALLGSRIQSAGT
jgi:hypothetical protein